MKNKVFIITNILGMGVALAICVVAWLAWRYDATFDATHTNRAAIYRIGAVREFDNSFKRFGYAPLALEEIIHGIFKDVDHSSPYINSNSNFKRNDDLFTAHIAYVRPDFFEMFSFDFISGSGAQLGVSEVFVSEHAAVRLFKTTEGAIGRTIQQVCNNKIKEVKIAGVYREPPPNSSFYKRDGSAFMHVENMKDEFGVHAKDDWSAAATVFVQINDAGRVLNVHEQLQAFLSNNNRERDDFQLAEFTLDPYATLAHRDRDEDVQAATWPAPPLSAVVGSMIMSILILLIACFNLTNTTVAISSRRLKEIGIRKVMGSKRFQLVFQFIAETAMICFIALAVGMALSNLMIDGWNLMTNNNIHLEADYYNTPGFPAFLAIALLTTAVLAGSYPAFYISTFNPVGILKGKLKFGGTNNFTRTLLGLQFAISMMAIASSIAFLQNAQYQEKFDLGFDVRGAVVTRINDKSEFNTYRDVLESHPAVISIAGAKSGIFSERLHEPVKHGALQAEVDIIEVGDNYLTTLGLQLIEGRDFARDSETDRQESVIITQKMANLFKWHDPLGKEIIWKDTVKLHVIGVVKNVYTHGLWREMEPMMIRNTGMEEYRQLIVRAQAEDIPKVNTFMEEQWSKIFPNRLYNGYIMGNALQDVTALSTSIVYGYAFLGVVAMLLSATGLYSLLSLNVIRRMKEIGIRKIVGASVFNVTRVVNTEFVIILAVASILGALASYNWCSIIMDTIWKYHQPVNIWTLVSAVVLLFAVSLLTIAHKLYKVATMNPVDSLRME